MDSLEEIGALLGFVAFAGLAVLVFLTFQQARHVRRLRDWAGRAPERAAAEAEREAGQRAPETGAEREPSTQTGEHAGVPVGETGEHTGDYVYEETGDEPALPGALRASRQTGESRWVHLREELAVRWEEWDRRSAVDPKIILGGLAAVIIGVLIATGAFGLVGGGDDGASTEKAAKSGKANKKKDKDSSSSAGASGGSSEVAVLNGTAPAGGVGVPGVADKVSGDVENAGFTVGEVGDAGSFAASVVMYRGEGQADAEELAASLETLLGPTEVVEMTPDIEAASGNADVALVIGADDSAV